MRTGLSIALTLSFAIAQSTSIKPNSAENRRPKSREAEVLATRIQHARSAAPEFRSDLLIHLATAANEPLSKNERLQLLQDAFETASNAQEPLPLQQVLGGSDSLSGSVRLVLARGMDRLSLQSRAIIAIAELNRGKAAKLSEEVFLGPVTKKSCTDWFEYDFARLYRMYEATGRAALAADTLQHITQLAPLLDVLANLPYDERVQRSGQIALWLQNSTPDWHATLTSLDKLAGVLPRFVIGLPQSHRIAVADAFRRSFADHLAVDWCEGFSYRENVSDPRVDPPDQLIAFFERVILPFAGPNATPLHRKMVKGRSTPGRVSDRFWQRPSETNLHAEFLNLFLKTDSISKQSPEWRAKSNDLFDALRVWRGEDAIDRTYYFLEKSLLYRIFVTSPTSPQPFVGRTQDEARKYLDERKKLPELPERRRALEELVLWLDGPIAAHVYDHRRLYWFGQMDALLSAAAQGGIDKESVYALFRAAKHPVLGAYGTVLSTASSRP